MSVETCMNRRMRIRTNSYTQWKPTFNPPRLTRMSLDIKYRTLTSPQEHNDRDRIDYFDRRNTELASVSQHSFEYAVRYRLVTDARLRLTSLDNFRSFVRNELVLATQVQDLANNCLMILEYDAHDRVQAQQRFRELMPLTTINQNNPDPRYEHLVRRIRHWLQIPDRNILLAIEWAAIKQFFCHIKSVAIVKLEVCNQLKACSRIEQASSEISNIISKAKEEMVVGIGTMNRLNSKSALYEKAGLFGERIRTYYTNLDEPAPETRGVQARVDQRINRMVDMRLAQYLNALQTRSLEAYNCLCESVSIANFDSRTDARAVELRVRFAIQLVLNCYVYLDTLNQGRHKTQFFSRLFYAVNRYTPITAKFVKVLADVVGKEIFIFKQDQRSNSLVAAGSVRPYVHINDARDATRRVPKLFIAQCEADGAPGALSHMCALALIDPVVNVPRELLSPFRLINFYEEDQEVGGKSLYDVEAYDLKKNKTSSIVRRAASLPICSQEASNSNPLSRTEIANSLDLLRTANRSISMSSLQLASLEHPEGYSGGPRTTSMLSLGEATELLMPRSFLPASDSPLDFANLLMNAEDTSEYYSAVVRDVIPRVDFVDYDSFNHEQQQEFFSATTEGQAQDRQNIDNADYVKPKFDWNLFKLVSSSDIAAPPSMKIPRVTPFPFDGEQSPSNLPVGMSFYGSNTQIIRNEYDRLRRLIHKNSSNDFYSVILQRVCNDMLFEIVRLDFDTNGSTLPDDEEHKLNMTGFDDLESDVCEAEHSPATAIASKSMLCFSAVIKINELEKEVCEKFLAALISSSDLIRVRKTLQKIDQRLDTILMELAG